MAATKEKTTYIFLASRRGTDRYDDISYNYTEDGTAQIQKKKGQEIVSLDVTTKLSMSWNGSVSSYAVSGDSDISDHLTIKNDKYTLSGVVSDTPIQRYENETLGYAGTGGRRVMASLQLLRQMYEEKVIFDLYSEYERISNVVITDIDFDIEAQNAIEFRIQMEQVRFAYAKTVSLNVSSGTKKKIASNKNGGGSTKVNAETSTYEKNRDALIEKNNKNV